jgi:fructose-bisphosphate aldolase class II
MSLVSMKGMLQQAMKEHYAVGQFNLNNLEFTQAILQAAEEEQAPVILGLSEAYIPYMGGLSCVASIVRNLIDYYEISVPVALHLDHGSSFEVCVKAMDAGFTSVMIDGSHHPLAHNIELTKRVTDVAHVLGISVEAELGRIGGREDDLIVDEADAMYAVTADCEQLVRETGIDCLAPALGSVHGPYRGEPRLGFARMEEIGRLIGLPLVLHGGSGIPDDAIQKAISLHTAKINVNTENQMAFSSMVKLVLAEAANEYDPRKYLGPAREAVKQAVRAKIRQFGSSGKGE